MSVFLNFLSVYSDVKMTQKLYKTLLRCDSGSNCYFEVQIHTSRLRSVLYDDPAIFSSVTYAYKVNSLVFLPNPSTAEDLKYYKYLVYNQMVCGWVRETEYQLINDHCVA